jgi:hypothetical protein
MEWVDLWKITVLTSLLEEAKSKKIGVQGTNPKNMMSARVSCFWSTVFAEEWLLRRGPEGQ